MKNRIKKLLSCYACGGDLVEMKSETGSMLVCKECKRYRNNSWVKRVPKAKKKVKITVK